MEQQFAALLDEFTKLPPRVTRRPAIPANSLIASSLDLNGTIC